MIVSKDKIKAIKERIRIRHNYFILRTLGVNQLTDAEIRELDELGFDTTPHEDYIADAYIAGHTRGAVEPSRFSEEQHNNWKHTRVHPALTDTERYAIEHFKENIAQNTQKLSTQVQQTVENLIREGNLKQRNFVQTEKTGRIFIEGIQEHKTVQEVAKQLRDGTEDFARDWKRVVSTELNNAQSFGAADAMVKRNEGVKEPHEVYCYKILVQDAALCDYCRKFYLNPDGTPKVYKVSELMKNGTNYGKKPSEWKPVIGSVHPNCRDRLVELPDGWGFRPGSDRLEYIGPDYIHYES